MMAARKAMVVQQAARASSERELVDTQRLVAAKRMAPVAMPAPPSDATNAAPVLAEAASAAPVFELIGGAKAPVTDEPTAANSSDTPTQELDKIRQLFAHGHDAEARERLAAFQHAHPQAELPPELREKLRQP